MRRVLAFLICSLLLITGVTTVSYAEENKDKKQEQKKEEDKKEDKKEDKEGQPHKPILIVVYEFAWPPVIR